MKTKIFLLATTLLLSFGINANAQKKDNKKETVELDVNMTCHSCKQRIERNIAFEKGVTDMKVDLDQKTVTIEYRTDKTDLEKLQAAFEKLGYVALVHLKTEEVEKAAETEKGEEKTEKE